MRPQHAARTVGAEGALAGKFALLTEGGRL